MKKRLMEINDEAMIHDYRGALNTGGNYPQTLPDNKRTIF